MKKVGLVILTVMMSVSIWAQDEKNIELKENTEKAAYQVEYLTIILDLAQDQVAQLKRLQKGSQINRMKIKEQYEPIMEKMKGELESLKDNPSVENREKAKRIKESYEEELAPMKEAIEKEKNIFDTKFIKILNEDQKTKYIKLQALKAKKKEGQLQRPIRGLRGDM